MQRQSLGSPSTKLHHHHLHEPTSISSSPIKSLSNGEIVQVEDEEEDELKKLKLKKPINNININSKHETYIHLIPMLTLLCFLILYLSSHNPSQNDLAEFSLYNPNLHIHQGMGESVSELERVMDIKKGDILAIRSLKNLKQQEEGTGGGLGKHRRLHRKFGFV